MKIHIFVLTFLFSYTFAGADTKSTLHIFLVGGQSNAVGVDTADKLSKKLQKPQENIPFYYKVWPDKGQPNTENIYTTLRPGAGGASKENSFGPELSYGPALAAYYEKVKPGDRVAIIKFARGGTNLYSQWKPNGTDSTKGDGSVYRLFQEVVHAGLERLSNDPELKHYNHRLQAMIWVQGESDLSHDHAKDYAENLTVFIQDVRHTFQNDLAFYFTRVSDNQTLYPESKDTKKAANFHLIRKQQQEVGENVANAFMVDIDAPQFSMLKQRGYHPLFLHFDAKGTVAIGEAFASAYIKNQKKTR